MYLSRLATIGSRQDLGLVEFTVDDAPASFLAADTGACSERPPNQWTALVEDWLQFPM
jgi:hypothetical protein